MGSDFWWINQSERNIYRYIDLVNHRLPRDDEVIPLKEWHTKSCMCYEIDNWRKQYENTNVYRSLGIKTKPSGEDELIGPFLIDIDNGDQNLEDALQVTRNTLGIIHRKYNVTEADIRIFFSGHKGFNIEIRPDVLEIRGKEEYQIRTAGSMLEEIIRELRVGYSCGTTNQINENGTVIDLIYGSRRSGYELKHNFIRLHNSINSWIESSGEVKARMKIKIEGDEVKKLTIQEILARSEGLVT